MSFFKDKYNTISEFFKDIRRAIDSLTTRIDDLDMRRDEAVVTQAPMNEDSPEPESVELSVSVDEFGIASLQLDNDTDPVKIVGGEGVTLSVNMEGALQIDVTGGTNGSSSGGGSSGGGSSTPTPSTGGVERYVFGSTGIFQLAANSENIISYPQPLDSAGNNTNIYFFGNATNVQNTLDAIQNVVGFHPTTRADDLPSGSTVSYYGFYSNENGAQDRGNMVLILPLDPEPFTVVKVRVLSKCTSVIIVSVQGKRIVDIIGWRGTGGGCYTHAVYENEEVCYIYINSTSGWPKYHYDNNPGFDVAEAMCASDRTDPGCWIMNRID